MADNRFCVDCKFYSLPWRKRIANFDARCTKNDVQNINLVSGKITRSEFSDLDRCRTNRINGYESDDDHCGPSGKNWIPKEDTPTNLIKLLSR